MRARTAVRPPGVVYFFCAHETSAARGANGGRASGRGRSLTWGRAVRGLGGAAPPPPAETAGMPRLPLAETAGRRGGGRRSNVYGGISNVVFSNRERVCAFQLDPEFSDAIISYSKS